MKPATISIASIAGTLGVVAAIGFAQPDGLQPPAGSVEDTQPSLATIEQAILDLNSGQPCDEPLEFEHTPELAANNVFTLGVGQIRLERIRIIQGAFTVTDSAGRAFRIFADFNLNANSRIETRADDYGVVLDGPVVFTAVSNQNRSEATIFYRELP